MPELGKNIYPFTVITEVLTFDLTKNYDTITLEEWGEQEY